MSLELKPPLPPMEALSVDDPPVGKEWQYEPKWDGFRCLAFRNGPDIYFQSKSGQPLARYFPDLVQAIGEIDAPQFVLDGEIVIPVSGRLSFDDLLLRVHPAASRVQKLAAEHPAMFIIFDLLADERGHSLLPLPLGERRVRLEAFAATHLSEAERLRLSPATQKLSEARKWFNARGANLDGIVAKRRDLEYRSGLRDGMQKIKHRRTADCVVGGFRYGEGKKVIGSLLLGLYDDEGLLNHVGFTSAFTEMERKKVTEIVKPLAGGVGFTGRSPGGPSRWSKRPSDDWVRLKPTLVVEVEYDHFTGGRFRHGTKFMRWRPDKAPRQCVLNQVDRKAG
jgi:ATP-dependent DNA ligase